MVAIRRRKLQHVRELAVNANLAVNLREDGVGAEVRAVAARREDNDALHRLLLTTLLVLDTTDLAAFVEQLRDPRLERDLRAAILLIGDFLQLLHQRVRNGHARELLLSPVRALL